jgi:hypothetical protein
LLEIRMPHSHRSGVCPGSFSEIPPGLLALGSTLAGSDRPLIITSAIGVLPPSGLATEETMPASGSTASPRAASEEAADSVAAHGVRVSVVRLGASVHGDGDRGGCLTTSSSRLTLPRSWRLLRSSSNGH